MNDIAVIGRIGNCKNLSAQNGTSLCWVNLAAVSWPLMLLHPCHHKVWTMRFVRSTANTSMAKNYRREFAFLI